MLEARGLQKRYRGRLVVDRVDVQVDRGRVVGLLGPNGAGKTTCFDMIVGLVEPDGGSILIEEDDVTHRPVSARAHRGLGYLPQEPSIFRNLDVASNVMAALELRRDLDRSGRRRQRDRLLDDLNVAHLSDRKGISLSGGERRRVEIARALAASPVYMLLDEPFAGIDPISVGDIRDTVRHLTDRGIGVLITDHNVRETLELCDEAYILNAGEILAQGTPEEILADDAVRAVYLGRDFKL